MLTSILCCLLEFYIEFTIYCSDKKVKKRLSIFLKKRIKMFSKFMRLIYPYVELSFFLLQIALSHRKRDKDIEVEKEGNEIE